MYKDYQKHLEYVKNYAQQNKEQIRKNARIRYHKNKETCNYERKLRRWRREEFLRLSKMYEAMMV